MKKYRTEDEVRDSAKIILGFNENEPNILQGTGQITTFNSLGFKGVNDKPDGWYLPNNRNTPAIILETKSEKINISTKKCKDEIAQNCIVALKQFKQVIGILYNGVDVKVFKNNVEITDTANTLQNKSFYLALFTDTAIDKERVYKLTKDINDCLHFSFGLNNLQHRMIFTACALVACGNGALLTENMNYEMLRVAVYTTLKKQLHDSQKHNQKINLLLEVFDGIKMNSTENQEAINFFIENVKEISEYVTSDQWNGEDVMGIFFNEFNRYKSKSDQGQVFTPDHITSFMYRLIEINQHDRILDAACGSGAFLVKAMCNMIKEAGGINTSESDSIMNKQLFGIEFVREIYALACANMLIHKDGKTNLEQLDSRTTGACEWIRALSFMPDGSLTKNYVTKVLMNPPFERKYGCITIVNNVLLNVPKRTLCAFILPDRKLDYDNGKKLLKHSTLKKIIKLPEKVFFEGITTSVFIFESGIPHKEKKIFTCYIEEDGLETVKNKGRQDVHGKWQNIEDTWIDIINTMAGSETIQWIDPTERLSYCEPEKEFELSYNDFSRVITDRLLYERKINVKQFSTMLAQTILYNSGITANSEAVSIILGKRGDSDGE